ncbi:MAG: hypothetical protein JNL38_18800 [Myxococcales bacterium]|jgi:hypothetical protein|nr:hypothetical protein [Myxococcales bacterium]
MTFRSTLPAGAEHRLRRRSRAAKTASEADAMTFPRGDLARRRVNLGAALNSTVEKNPLQSVSPEPTMATKNARKLPPAPSPKGVPGECERTRLIGEISRLLREPMMPESTRTAGLTLIGWLARRMPGEAPHALGVEEARKSEQRMKSARKAR